MKRKSRFIFLFALMLVLTASVPISGEASGIELEKAQGPNFTERANNDFPVFSETQQQMFGHLVGEFVLGFFSGQESLSLPDKIKIMCVDNDEMYYVLRRQQYLIDAITVMGGGQIRDLKLLETALIDIQKLSDVRIQVKAYVRVAFRYMDDPEQRQTGAGIEVAVTLLRNEKGQHLIENYTEYSSEFASMKSHYLNYCKKANKEGAIRLRELTDQYFANRIEQLKEDREHEKDIYQKNENIVETDSDTTIDSLHNSDSLMGVSVNYNRQDAAAYARNEGQRYELIFHRITDIDGYDCTNFVSQALWVGYGGDLGDYFNYINTSNNTFLYNCKFWASMKFRMIPGNYSWWGASKKDSFQFPAGPWMRVWQLWAYLSTTSNGPRADKYNDGLLYTSCSSIIWAGDILQFSHDPNEGYGHSVMVVNNAYSTLSNGVNSIYVAQHSYDTGWRQLSSVISTAGDYIRIIRPINGIFVE